MEENIYSIPEFTPERARKYHFWRGFRSAAIVFVPIILALMYGLTVALNSMQGLQ